MREIVHIQAGQCGNQIGAKVKMYFISLFARLFFTLFKNTDIIAQKYLMITKTPLAGI